MRAVDAVIRRRLGSEVVLINQIGEYIISAGGKRLRPVILLLVANALGYKGEYHHELAAVVEFIHTATLLHDDVVDESDLRRGRKTANAVFGNAASVLVGDFLYSRAFQMMVQANSMRIMQILADATNIISEGEVLQLLNMHDPDVTEERYLQVIRYKTAKLFEAAAQIGAVLSGADAATEEAAAEYGRRIGTAFQIIDDLLDYTWARTPETICAKASRRCRLSICYATARKSNVLWCARPSSKAAPNISTRSSLRFKPRARWNTRAKPLNAKPQPQKLQQMHYPLPFSARR